MFHTYMLASRRNGTIYTGHTDCLPVRVEQHQTKAFEGFTARYNVDRLVWYEGHPTRHHAFKREHAIKHWRRTWKLSLIESGNASWRDLGPDLIEFWTKHGWIPPCGHLLGYMSAELEVGPLSDLPLLL